MLPLKNHVEATSTSLDEEEKGISGGRLFYLLFHVRHALHGLAVYLQDHVTPLNGGVVSGATGLYACHYHPVLTLGAELPSELRGEALELQTPLTL